MQERGDLRLPAHRLESLGHLVEKGRVGPTFPELLQLAEDIAINEVGGVKGFFLRLVDQRQRVAVQRPDLGINDLMPGVEAAILAPKIMVDVLDGIVIARTQGAGAEAEQIPRQQARAVALELEAQVPGAPPIEPDGIEVVDPGGNAGFVAFPDSPLYPAQRLEGQPAQGMEDRQRIMASGRSCSWKRYRRRSR